MNMMLIKALSQSQGLAANLYWGDMGRQSQAQGSLQEPRGGGFGGTERKASPGRQEQQVAMLNVHTHASVLRNCCYFYEKNAERLIENNNPKTISWVRWDVPVISALRG